MTRQGLGDEKIMCEPKEAQPKEILELWRICEIANQLKVVKTLLTQYVDVGFGQPKTEVEILNLVSGGAAIISNVIKDLEELPDMLEEVGAGEREII